MGAKTLLLLALAAPAGAKGMKPWARIFLHHAPPKGGFTRVLQVIYSEQTPNREPLQVISHYIDTANRRMRVEAYPNEGRLGAAWAVLYNGNDQYNVHPTDPYFLDGTSNQAAGDHLPWARPDWGRRVGSGEALGRACEVYERRWDDYVRRVCVWRGVLLREETRDHFMEAVHIDERATVPEFIMDAARLSRIEYPTGNPHDFCRVDALSGDNITRFAYLDKEQCRERLCDEYGPANAAQTASVCVFREKEIGEYGTQGMDPRKVAASKAWLRYRIAAQAGRAADMRKALDECRRQDPEDARCKAATKPARLKRLQPLAR